MTRLNERKNKTVIVAAVTLNVEFRKKMRKYLIIASFFPFSIWVSTYLLMWARLIEARDEMIELSCSYFGAWNLRRTMKSWSPN